MICSDKNVLVTGGAGFIGSHLVKRLLDLGSVVSVADDFSRGKRKNIEPFLDKINLHVVDLTKIENCVKATEGINYVFHLAASVGGIHYIKKENVGGSTPSLLMNTNMLEAARLNDVERFLFTSSACIYREKTLDLNRFKEEDAYPANPPTTYGWAKLMGEIQCKSYYLDYGIKSSAVRIFNAYGENENLDPKWSHVIPSTIRKAILYPKEELKIFGDGSQERAFLYVKDCVEGLLLCMEKIEDAEPINLGSEELVSVNELTKKIVSLSGKKIKIKNDLTAPPGTHRYCADTTRMKKVLAWSPRTPLSEGLKRTYEWARSELNVG
nr:NAD-dependent epimerase/dehydratase family protein [Candidatus Freyarchaeota archaeon]